MIHIHNPSSKPVAQISPTNNKIIKTYESIGKAAKGTGISATFISGCCKGKYKLAKGYIWEFI